MGRDPGIGIPNQNEAKLLFSWPLSPPRTPALHRDIDARGTFRPRSHNLKEPEGVKAEMLPLWICQVSSVFETKQQSCNTTDNRH